MRRPCTYHMFKSTQNFTRGFCSWRFIRGQETDNVRSGPLSAVDVSPHLPDGKNDLKCNRGLTQYLLNMLDRKTEEDYLTPRLFRAACKWLEENRENAPWMLWIDSFAPHELWDPPMEFADAYCPPGKSRNYIQPHVINGTNPSADEIDRTRALYYGYVTFVDKWIGALIGKLEQMGSLEDTAVLFTSDHGTELWDKGQFGKGGNRLYGYNTRIPLLLRLPGGRDGGTERSDFAQPQDLAPTIWSLMGFDGAEMTGVDGRDLLDDASTKPESVIVGWGQNVSIRDDRWNLTFRYTDADADKVLFDLQADPEENENVAEANPDIVRELISRMETKIGPLPFEVKHRGDGRQAPPLSVIVR